MVKWLNKYVLGWMCVPCKSHPFGNEYHTIADGNHKSPILYRVELVEQKDRPCQLVKKEFGDLGGQKIGLMVRMT